MNFTDEEEFVMIVDTPWSSNLIRGDIVKFVSCVDTDLKVKCVKTNIEWYIKYPIHALRASELAPLERALYGL